MKTLKRIETYQYSPREFGLLKCKRRLTRLYVQETRQDAPFNEAAYRALLPAIYERMGRNSLAPLPMPEKIDVTWSEKDQAFVLHGAQLHGFFVVAHIQTSSDDQEHAPNASQETILEENGSALPRLA